MNLHEYQAKQLFSRFGLPVLPGILCTSPEEVEAAASRLGQRCVLKAQVHAGGRGKAGGIKLASSAAEARKISEQMLGMRLVTPQTGPQGKLVSRLYVEAPCEIAREFYLSMLVDRSRRRLTFIASTEGGTEIEETARRSPELVQTIEVDPAAGFKPDQARLIAAALKIPAAAQPALERVAKALYRAFTESDLSLAEINPLVIDSRGELVLLDAKASIDDNALFRHQEIAAMKDPAEYDQRDLQASALGVSYVGMTGDIACMVNGAGLAMATMDIIQEFGGSPANFLDVGGGASREMVAGAFRILVLDKNVKGILINIFGGIMRCDVVASGIVDAARELELRMPLVVRLHGTNFEQGREILSRSGLNITPVSSMDEAARTIVEAVRRL